MHFYGHSRRLLFAFIISLAATGMAGHFGTASAQAVARARIEGFVTSAQSNEPLPDVHVFISKSTIGAVTDEEGHFLITIPLGANRIVVSMVGFLTQTRNVMVRAPRQYKMDFTLREDVLSLEGITVSGERDPDWDDQLARFKKQFIGETPNAELVEIENPQVLNFQDTDGRFVANSVEPIFVLNRALGYRLEHHLNQFLQEGDETWQDGESFFEELVPADSEEAIRWENARETAWLGSAHHFFVSLVQKRTKESGFITYAVAKPRPVGENDPFVQNQAAPFKQPHFAVNPAIYLNNGKSEREFMFEFNNYLEVIYTRAPEDRAYGAWQRVYHSGKPRPYQHSWLRLQKGPVTVDNQGNIINPYGVAYFGYMAFERLADLVPRGYRPRVQ